MKRTLTVTSITCDPMTYYVQSGARHAGPGSTEVCAEDGTYELRWSCSLEQAPPIGATVEIEVSQ